MKNKLARTILILASVFAVLFIRSWAQATIEGESPTVFPTVYDAALTAGNCVQAGSAISTPIGTAPPLAPAAGPCGSAAGFMFAPLPGSGTATMGFRQNIVSVTAITNWSAAALTISTFSVNITTLDATGLYSFGIYGPCAPGTASCPLVFSSAATSFASTGEVELAPTQTSPVSFGAIAAANTYYYVAFTGNATVAKFDGSSGRYFSPVCDASTGTASTGGALPATVNIPAASWGACASVPIFQLHD